MAQVTHTVKWVYGSYSGKTNSRVDEDADMGTIEARIRRVENLNFLSMASTSFKVVATVRDEDDDNENY